MLNVVLDVFYPPMMDWFLPLDTFLLSQKHQTKIALTNFSFLVFLQKTLDSVYILGGLLKDM